MNEMLDDFVKILCFMEVFRWVTILDGSYQCWADCWFRVLRVRKERGEFWGRGKS